LNDRTAPAVLRRFGDRDLFAQYIAYRQDQVTAEIIRSFSVRVFDSVVTGIVSEVSVLEFSVPVLNDFSAYLSTEKVVQGFGFGLTARVNYHGTTVFYGAVSDRVFNAIAQSRHSHRLRIYLRIA
jgi:hypothetical protein